MGRFTGAGGSGAATTEDLLWTGPEAPAGFSGALRPHSDPPLDAQRIHRAARAILIHLAEKAAISLASATLGRWASTADALTAAAPSPFAAVCSQRVCGPECRVARGSRSQARPRAPSARDRRAPRGRVAPAEGSARATHGGHGRRHAGGSRATFRAQVPEFEG